MDVLTTLMPSLQDHRLGGRLYVFEDYQQSTVLTLLEILAERIDTDESEFYQLAISAVHEAFCGRRADPEAGSLSLQAVRMEIVTSLGMRESLFDMLCDRPLSSFSPLFMSFFPPDQLITVFGELGFPNLRFLAWYVPDNVVRADAESWYKKARDFSVEDLTSIAYGASAIAVNVYSHELKFVASRCIAQRLVAGTTHELDMSRLQEHVRLFLDARMTLTQMIKATRCYFYMARQTILLSRDCLTSTCTHGMLRLMAAWSSQKSTLHVESEDTLIKIVLTGCDFTAFECQLSRPQVSGDRDICWGLMNLPHFVRSAWFLNHNVAPSVYDLDAYARAPEGEKRQYELGLLYYLLDDRDLQENLPDNMVLRFCITQAGGVRQPDVVDCHPFDSSVVLVAPPGSLRSLFFVDRNGNVAAPRIMCTPLQDLQSAEDRRRALTEGLTPRAKFTELAARLTCPPQPAPILAAGTSPIPHYVRLLTPPVWEHHPALEETDGNLRSFYKRFKADVRVAERRPHATSTEDPRGLLPSSRHLVESGLSPLTAVAATTQVQKLFPVGSVPPVTTPRDSTELESRALGDSTPQPTPQRFRGLLAQLPTPTRTSGEPSFLQLAIRGLELIATVPFNNFSSAPDVPAVDKFAFYTKRSTTPPPLGELFLLVVFTVPGAMQPGYQATWADVLRSHTAIYEVTSLSERSFSGTFVDVYAAPEQEPPKQWPHDVHQLPYPNPAQPCRLVFTPAWPLAAADSSSQETAGGHDGPPIDPQGDGRGTSDILPVPPRTVGSTRGCEPEGGAKSRQPSAKKHSVTYYSSDSDSSASSSSSSRRSHRKHKPAMVTDPGGRKVLVNKGTTAEKILATTPVRGLMGPKRVEETLREEGNVLNNYTFESFLVGAVNIYRNESHTVSLYQTPGGGILTSPALSLAWHTHKAILKDIPRDIVFWNWAEFLNVTTTSPRLVHLLPADRIRTLTNNELGSWFDFTDTILGLERTYGLFYPPPWEETFHDFHQFVVRNQVGALLSVSFLEYWLLDVLAFVRRAAREPAREIRPSDLSRYPQPITTVEFSPQDWCTLLRSELYFRLSFLTVANNENFTRSLQFPVPRSVVHPFGAFADKPKTQTNQPSTAPSTVTTSVNQEGLSRAERKAAKRAEKKKKASLAADTAPAQRTQAKNRLCLHSLCNQYKLPLVAAEGRAGGVPQKCKPECPYMHMADLPAGTTKAAVLEKYRRSLEKLLTPTDVEAFAKKLNADSRLA